MTQRLYISFWNIGLQNLPDGNFRRRTLGADAAKLLIEEARRDGSVMGVTGEDLLAPYKKRELENHRGLCSVLTNRFGIPLSLKEFFSSESEDGALQFVNPLDFATVGANSQLLVVSCAYNWVKPPKETGELLAFEVAHDSITFHLFEEAPNARLGSSLDSFLEEKGIRGKLEARTLAELQVKVAAGDFVPTTGTADTGEMRYPLR